MKLAFTTAMLLAALAIMLAVPAYAQNGGGVSVSSADRDNGHHGYDHSLGVGNAYGQTYGPPADKDCPRSPYWEAVRKDETMTRPVPAWGCVAGEACGGAFEYWGTTKMTTHPNKAHCEWSAEHNNKRMQMLNRCWPLWNGKPNVSNKTWTCG